MRVEFEYTPAYVLGDLEKVDMPPDLEIHLEWDPPVPDHIDAVVMVYIGQNVDAVFASDLPVRLVSVGGLLEEPAAWRLVPDLVGPAIWQEAQSVLEGQLLGHSIEVDASTFEPYLDAWRVLREAAQSGQVAGMPASREKGDKVMRVLRSDPTLWAAYTKGMEKAVDELRNDAE